MNAGRRPGVGAARIGQGPEVRVDVRSADDRATVADHLIGQPLIVTVPSGGKAHPHQPRRQRLGHRRRQRASDRVGRVLRTELVGCRRLEGEPGQALLEDPVHRRELSAQGDIGVVAFDGPRTLELARKRSRIEGREPIEDLAAGNALVVPAITVRTVVRQCRRRRQSHGPLPPDSRIGVGEATDHGAVMRMSHEVEHTSRLVGVVCVAMAVVGPNDRPVARSRRKRTFEVRGGAEGPGRPPNQLSVRLQRVDRSAGGGGHQLARCPRKVRHPGVLRDARVRVDRALTCGGDAVELRELATHDDLRAVRSRLEGPDVAIVGPRTPGAGRPVEPDRGGIPSGGAVEAGELATDVDGVAGYRDGPNGRIECRSESRDEGTRRGVEGCEVAARLPVHRREVATDIDARSIGGPLDRHPLSVQRVVERCDALTRGDVVGEKIAGGHLGGTSHGGARRARRCEAARDVDGVADDDLGPDDAVDLPGRQAVGRHGRRIGRPGRDTTTGRRRGVGHGYRSAPGHSPRGEGERQ